MLKGNGTRIELCNFMKTLRCDRIMFLDVLTGEAQHEIFSFPQIGFIFLEEEVTYDGLDGPVCIAQDQMCY